MSKLDTERRKQHGSVTENEERGGRLKGTESPGSRHPDHPAFYPGLILSGEIPVVQAGCQKLVNVDLVFDYLANQGTSKPIRYTEREGVRT